VSWITRQWTYCCPW